ncbi:MAG: hypothetical protein HN413_15815 [Chloroflexi bacterium]|nr:hypothetical protein [Chloroflexota bacterium]
MKKHQPFETWILLDEPLAPEQAQLLNAHLKTCEACHALRAAWGRVDAMLQETPTLEPAPGFVTRWQAQLSQQRSLQRYARQRWQSWITLILIANAVSAFAVLLGWQVFNSFSSLTEILILLVQRATTFITVVNVFQNLFAVAFRTLPGLLPPAGWAVVAALISIGSLIWVISLSRLARMRWRTQ